MMPICLKIIVSGKITSRVLKPGAKKQPLQRLSGHSVFLFLHASVGDSKNEHMKEEHDY